jgi:hypothetical protein
MFGVLDATVGLIDSGRRGLDLGFERGLLQEQNLARRVRRRGSGRIGRLAENAGRAEREQQ